MTWTTGLFIAWLGCQGADITTTAVALRRGAVEQNALVRGGRGYAIKAGINLGALVGWGRAKTPARKNILATTFAVAGCVPAALNVRTLGRR